MIFLTTNTEK